MQSKIQFACYFIIKTNYPLAMRKLRIVSSGILHFRLFDNKHVVIVNFILDAALCTLSLLLNITLFFPKHKTPIAGKIGLLFATLCFAAFTYFAFLMPENGLPPVLFG